jgi:DNA polymerase (family 10)
MENCTDIKQIKYAGSLRRKSETIGDIDILVTVKDSLRSRENVFNHFIKYGEIHNVISRGETKSSVILKSGIDVDLRVVPEESFGAALHYFTGDKQHNIKIRDIAKKKGMKVNEYGVFKGEKQIAGKTEEEVFEAVGIPYIIPEIRLNEGEIEYAMKHKKFPKFVELSDIRGDVHSHSKYSDGQNNIEEMAKAYISKGYEYFAMTDHSPAVGIAGGMQKRDIEKQWREIEELNKTYKGKIKILKGAEVDILKDGSLDFENSILKKLDVVIISAHLHSRLPEAQQTKRLIAAIENPYAKILGHPMGRLLNKRAPMIFDMEKIIDACIINKVALEINASPMRLDLPDKYIKIAKEMGAKFVVSTDSHSIYQPDYMEYGVGMARRGWLGKDNILNCLSWEQFDSYF